MYLIYQNFQLIFDFNNNQSEDSSCSLISLPVPASWRRWRQHWASVEEHPRPCLPSSFLLFFLWPSSTDFQPWLESRQFQHILSDASFSLKHTEDLSLQIINTRGDLYNSRIRLDYWLDGWFGPRSAWVCRGLMRVAAIASKWQKDILSPINGNKWGLVWFQSSWHHFSKVDLKRLIFSAQLLFLRIKRNTHWPAELIGLNTRPKGFDKLSSEGVIIAIWGLPQVV